MTVCWLHLKTRKLGNELSCTTGSVGELAQIVYFAFSAALEVQ